MKKSQIIILNSLLIILLITCVASIAGAIIATIHRVHAEDMPETKIGDAITISRELKWFDYDSQYRVDYIENTQNTVSTEKISKNRIIIDNTVTRPYITKRSAKALFITDELIYLHISQKDYIKLQDKNSLTYDNKGGE